jgi:hypothetical protein
MCRTPKSASTTLGTVKLQPFRKSQAETLAMQTEEAIQYTPRFQSPEAKQAIADPRLQTQRSVGKISLFGNGNANTCHWLVGLARQFSHPSGLLAAFRSAPDFLVRKRGL